MPGKIWWWVDGGNQRQGHYKFEVQNWRGMWTTWGILYPFFVQQYNQSRAIIWNRNKVVMNGEFLWVYESQGKLLMKVKRSANRLYKIIIESGESKCLLSKLSENAWLWHSRLGHVNFKAMELMSANNMVHGFPKITSSETVCTGCLMSKQTRKPFPSKLKYSASKVL